MVCAAQRYLLVRFAEHDIDDNSCHTALTQPVAASTGALDQKHSASGNVLGTHSIDSPLSRNPAKEITMNAYLLLKFLHIVSSVVLVGTGFGSAYYLFFANRTKSIAVKAQVSRLCVRADWWLTTPAVIVQPVTGFAMVYLAEFPLTTSWIAISFALYLFAGACWLPVVWLQLKMHAMAQAAQANNSELPAIYKTYRRWWEGLGYPAFISMAVVFYMMVTKPALWG